MRSNILRLLCCAVVVAGPAAKSLRAQQTPWPIRAVIVTTFEVGNDTGDTPGEFQLWAERERLSEAVDFPGGTHPLLTNADHTVLGVVSGISLVRASASMMALGLDPRFDLSHAYILINGIAGVDPNVASAGSAAWVRYVVGDFTHYIDPREMPKGWPYGFFPMGAKEPNPSSLPEPNGYRRSNLYTLNASLAEWAYEQTKNLDLGDDPKVAAFRAKYTGLPNAQRKPFVLLGDTFAADFFWHGAIMNKYAEDWVRLYTKGKGTFTMTETEDSGFMEAVERLDRMHRIDGRRVMLLRTASNYDMPPAGMTTIESLNAPFIGGRLGFESAWLCGSTVLHKILAQWDVTYATVPGK